MNFFVILRSRLLTTKPAVQLAFIGLLFVLSGCASSRPPIPPGTVPKARQISIEDEQYGHKVLSTLNENWELDYSHPRLDEIISVVDRLSRAAGTGDDPWHVYLFNAPKIKNAGATRGNHVFVWSGMLSVTTTEEELATVLAHEVAHVLSGHTDPDPNEEIRKMLIGIGALAAGVAVAQQTGDPTMGRNLGNLTSQVTQELGSGFLVNPYSRERELEADHVGLFLMASAKYRPSAAISFWQKAQNDPDFGGKAEFFSTHPPPANRLAQLRQYLPEAEARYRGESKPVTSARPRAADQTTTRSSSSNLPYRDVTNKSEKSAKRKDSFSWDQPIGNRTSPNQSRAARESTWLVTSKTTQLYEQPKRSAKALGEFRKNARVSVIRITPTWLEINYPDHGFLLRQDLEKE